MSKLYDLLNTIIGKVNKAVSTENQTLTENEKAQARANIGALSMLNPNDRELIVQEVITALGTPVFGRVDENNNIILTGELAEGNYTVKYEDSDGAVIDVGTIEKTPEVVNQIPLSINADGSQYVGENGEDGYKVGYRINSSGGETAESGCSVTGYIPIKKGDIIYFKNCDFYTSGGVASKLRVALYKADFTLHQAIYAYQLVTTTSYAYLIDNINTTGDSGHITSFTIRDNYGDFKNGGYLRIGMGSMNSSEIITINQEI